MHKYLDGLSGLEIGGSAHNPFGLKTLNVDYTNDMNTVFKLEEIKLCGEALPIDIVAFGDKIPVFDKSFDFVLSSHVLEHFWNPLNALREWKRIATMYIAFIVPHRTVEGFTTSFNELLARENIPAPENEAEHGHFTVFTPELIEQIVNYLDLELLELKNPDDKVGNGILAICKIK